MRRNARIISLAAMAALGAVATAALAADLPRSGCSRPEARSAGAQASATDYGYKSAPTT